jgi:hypothetical protein
VNTFEDTDEFLAHFGVKGMRWGVRRENRINRLERVGSGKGSTLDNIRVASGELSSKSMRRHGGVAGAAANKAANMRAVDARVASGRGTARDFVSRHGGDRYIDTGKLDKDVLAGKKLVARPGTSRVTMNVVKDFNSMSDKEFFQKYSGTKQTYVKRFDKYGGDPFMNSPMAKVGKVLAKTTPQPKRVRQAGGYNR